jgi:hypothetical protein
MIAKLNGLSVLQVTDEMLNALERGRRILGEVIT